MQYVEVNVNGSKLTFSTDELSEILSAAADVVKGESAKLHEYRLSLEDAFNDAGYDPCED